MHQLGYTNLTIANRTVANAQTIVDEMGTGRAISLAQAEETLADFSILVQMTSAGLATGNFSMPFSLDRLAKGAIVADIVYNPLMTPFYKRLRKKGQPSLQVLGCSCIKERLLSITGLTNTQIQIQ